MTKERQTPRGYVDNSARVSDVSEPEVIIGKLNAALKESPYVSPIMDDRDARQRAKDAQTQ